MVDSQAANGGRGGPSFHETRGTRRLTGAEKTIAVDYLGLPIGAAVHGARRRDVRAARDLLDELPPTRPRVADVLDDRGFAWARGPHLSWWGMQNLQPTQDPQPGARRSRRTAT